jgi:hypothetical protein
MTGTSIGPFRKPPLTREGGPRARKPATRRGGPSGVDVSGLRCLWPPLAVFIVWTTDFISDDLSPSASRHCLDRQWEALYPGLFSMVLNHLILMPADAPKRTDGRRARYGGASVVPGGGGILSVANSSIALNCRGFEV